MPDENNIAPRLAVLETEVLATKHSIQKLTNIVTGNGSPEKGLVMQLSRANQLLDRMAKMAEADDLRRSREADERRREAAAIRLTVIRAAIGVVATIAATGLLSILT